MTGAVEGFLFIDPGTSTGMCQILEGEPFLWTVKMRRRKGSNWTDDVAGYHDYVEQEIAWHRPKLVIVEAYAIAARGNALHKMVEIGAGIRLAAHNQGIPIIEIGISLWKSLTFRAKKGSKSEKLDYIYKAEQLTGVRAGNIDEADALLMAHAADLMLGDLSRWTEGIEKFRARVKEALK